MQRILRSSFLVLLGRLAITPAAALAQGIGSTIDPTTNANAPLGLTGTVRVGNFLITIFFWVLLAVFIAVTGWGILRAIQSAGDEERLAAAKKTVIIGVIGSAATLVLYGVAYLVFG